jgi:hypothetical protein
MADKPFKQLTRTRASLAGYHQLWLADKYLLAVQSTGYTETYKRFFFSEIQAFIIQRTKGALWFTLGCGAVFTLCLLVAVLSDQSEVQILFGVLAGLALAAMVTGLVWGPNCNCYIKTAVQTDRIPSIRRLRQAQRILARIQPLINAAQGTLAVEDLTQTGQRSQAEQPSLEPHATVAEATPATASGNESAADRPV